MRSCEHADISRQTRSFMWLASGLTIETLELKCLLRYNLLHLPDDGTKLDILDHHRNCIWYWEVRECLQTIKRFKFQESEKLVNLFFLMNSVNSVNSFILKKKMNTSHFLLQLWKWECKTFIIGLYNATPKKIKMKDVKMKRGIKTQTMKKRKEERTA